MIFAAGFSLLGGGLLIRAIRPRPQMKPLLLDLLNDPGEPVTSPSSSLPMPAPSPNLWGHLDRIKIEQHLFLSTSTLGLVTLSALGVPFLSLFSICGSLYLNLYFLRRAYIAWNTSGLIGVTDAIIATGLLMTRQFGAGALFATTYFVSQKLLKRTQTNLARQIKQPLQHTELIELTVRDTIDDCSQSTAQQTALPSQTGWQKLIRQGTLPFMILSAITMPLFGVRRALAVLVTNFGYDYRVTAPLSTLTYMELAAERKIVITDWRAFEQLRHVDVLLLDEQLFAVPVADHEEATVSSKQAPNWHILHELQQDSRRECFILHTGTAPTLFARANLALSATINSPINVPTVAPDEFSALIQKLQAAGCTIGWVSCTPLSVATAPPADVVEVVIDQQAKYPSDAQRMSEGAHIVMPTGDLEQLLALLQLADQLDHNLRRGFVISLLPSIFSLSGIYFFHFGAFIPLLLDGGGLAAGVLNAQLPRLRSRSMPPAKRTIDIRPVTIDTHTDSTNLRANVG